MDRVHFKINGRSCSVGCEVSSDMNLVDYIRNIQQLKGTKYMCRQGGCGACIVGVVKSPGDKIVAINSCLVPILSCQGWDIITVEKVGNKLDGYHPIQKALVKHFGSQCGYCSPGWVMSMYCLLESKKELTMLEIEKSFSGNICRCTGYRPIMDALKTFAVDAPKSDDLPDIEELKVCAEKCSDDCQKDIRCSENSWHFVSDNDTVHEPYDTEIEMKDGKLWYQARVIEDIFKLFSLKRNEPYMVICGNTARGIYPKEHPKNLIDISKVEELKGFYIDQNLVVGAATTLTDFIDILKTNTERDFFSYLDKLADHMNEVANVSVRNLGSIGGNLMMKHENRSFVSDIFLILETVGAAVTIATASDKRKTLTMSDFLETKMENIIIVSVSFRPLRDPLLIFYKIMPRSQSGPIIVNSGFFYNINKNETIREARIVYGGLSPPFSRAKKSELILKGKYLFRNETLQAIIKTLDKELIVTESPSETSTEYRKHLAKALFYKGLLTLCPKNKIDKRFRSGAINLNDTRPVSKGTQVYTTDESVYPITKPVEKVEALHQCSGEAVYTEDLPPFPGEVFAAFVVSDIGCGKIDNIDPSEALKCSGVIAFYSAKDIPGLNSFTPSDALLYSADEEILCSGDVKHYHQPVGIIAAESRNLAEVAAKMVKITYSAVKKPVTDIKEAIKDSKRLTQYMETKATDKGTDIFKVIKGSNTMRWQYHMTLETLVCITEPKENCLNVYAATQWMDGTQVMLSKILNLSAHRINVFVRRLGGGYGMKISRMIQIAAASALVACALNRPCRFIQSLSTNMTSIGKRFPCTTNYEVGVNKSGAIQYLNNDIYEDNGYMINETLSVLGTDSYYNCYDKSTYSVRGKNAVTDTPKNTWCRSPGTLENIAQIELIMDHISYAVDKDPTEVRLANLDSANSELREMINELKDTADYEERRAAVIEFNNNNRWKKRGIRIIPKIWRPIGGYNGNVTLSIFHHDGSIVMTHGGTEMGQGMNTKAVQACSYHLKVPVEKIRVEQNISNITPNSFITGGSLTTQHVVYGVKMCCENINARFQPLRDEHGDLPWEELVKKAFEANYNLQANSHVRMSDYKPYSIFGVMACETEIDVLTGQHEILRVDILQDVGKSVNPGIDIGQVEGAFMMGVGYWTSEVINCDKASGRFLTDSVHKYTVPLCRDIPQNFVVSLKENSYSNDLYLGSKAVGEPAICFSVGVALAMMEGISSARQNSGLSRKDGITTDGPFNAEKICMLSATNAGEFKLY